MKLPKHFMVFGQKTILKFEELPSEYAAQYHPEEKVIIINSKVNASEADILHSILHELGHALFFRVSINQAVNWQTHEFIVNNFATMLLENFEIKAKKQK